MKRFSNTQLIQIFNSLKDILGILSSNLYYIYIFSFFFVLMFLNFLMDTYIENVMLHSMDFKFQIMQSALLEEDERPPVPITRSLPHPNGLYWQKPEWTEDGKFIEPGGFRGSLNMYPVVAGLVLGGGILLTASIAISLYVIYLGWGGAGK